MIKAKDMNVGNIYNVVKYDLIENIILYRWQEHLALTEASWQQLCVVLSKLVAPDPMFAPATKMEWRVPLRYPQGAKQFTRNGFPGVSSPMVSGFLFTRDDLLNCSPQLRQLFLRCKALDSYFNTNSILQVDVLISTCGNKEFGWEFGRT